MITFPPFPFVTPDNPQSETSSPDRAENPQSPGRPRALDSLKREYILELMNDGFDLQQAAQRVRCSVRTIRREMNRDPLFADSVMRSEKFALENPISALRYALHRNWRAAAWLLERLFPERFARQTQKNAFGKRQARQLLKEVLKIVDADVVDSFQRERISGRIRATFEYLTHVYCERNQSKAGLRQAIEFFERKEKQLDPFADLAFFNASDNLKPVPDHEPEPATDSSPQTAADAPKPQSQRRAQHRTLNELFQDHIDDLKAIRKAARQKEKKTKAKQVLSPNLSSNTFQKDKMDKTTTPQRAETSQIHDREQIHPVNLPQFCP